MSGLFYSVAGRRDVKPYFSQDPKRSGAVSRIGAVLLWFLHYCVYGNSNIPVSKNYFRQCITLTLLQTCSGWINYGLHDIHTTHQPPKQVALQLLLEFLSRIFARHIKVTLKIVLRIKHIKISGHTACPDSGLAGWAVQEGSRLVYGSKFLHSCSEWSECARFGDLASRKRRAAENTEMLRLKIAPLQKRATHPKNHPPK